jgi:MOSC domain-containing protein YiiM
MLTIAELSQHFPFTGEVVWIGRRPARHANLVSCEAIRAMTGGGLEGDHAVVSRTGRAVTLVQSEHLAVIGALLRRGPIDPAILRRNLVIAGVNLTALKGVRFQIGEAILEGTGHCPPCSRMEAALGPGGYQAMRGHGGLTARVLSGGLIRVGDSLKALVDSSAEQGA